MKNKFVKSALVAGVILSASFIGNAQAATLVSSVVDVTDLQFSQGGTQLDYSNFSSIDFTNSSGVAASLNGADGAGNTDSPLGAVETDYFTEVGTNPGYADNNFTSNLLSSASGLPLLPAPGYNYAIGDQLETGSPITNLPNPNYDDTQPVGPGNQPTIGTPAHVANASFAGLANTGIGSADTNNELGASFVFSGISGPMDITFDIAYYLEVFVEAGDLAPSKAAGTYEFSMNIINLTDSSVPPLFNASIGDTLSLTAPGGSIGALTGWDYYQKLDGSVGIAGRLSPGVFDFESFAFTTGAFNETDTYQLAFRINTNADVQNVPEPGVLALLGLGLVGIGFTRRRAK